MIPVPQDVNTFLSVEQQTDSAVIRPVCVRKKFVRVTQWSAPVVKQVMNQSIGLAGSRSRVPGSHYKQVNPMKTIYHYIGDAVPIAVREFNRRLPVLCLCCFNRTPKKQNSKPDQVRCK